MDEKQRDGSLKKKMSRRKFWLLVMVGLLSILAILYALGRVYLDQQIRQVSSSHHNIRGPDKFTQLDWERKDYYKKQQALMSNVPADDVEKKLLQLLALPEGRITKEQVEQVFGVSLVLRDNTSKVYVLRSDSIVLESFYGYTPTGQINRYNFSFDWIRVERNLPLGSCIDSIEFANKLRQRGWLDDEPLRNTDSVHRHFFSKNPKAQLLMRYDSAVNCMLDIYVNDNKFL